MRHAELQLVLDQRAEDPVQQVAAPHARVPADQGEPARRALDPDQVGGRDVLPAPAQLPHHELQRGARRVRVAPGEVVEARVRHPGLVAGQRVERLEGVRGERDHLAGRRRLGIRRRRHQLAQALDMEPATDDQDIPGRLPDLLGHEPLATRVDLRHVIAQLRAQRLHPSQVLVQTQRRVDLGEHVPGRVEVVDAEPFAQRRNRAGAAQLVVAVAVRDLARARDRRPRQVDEAHVGADLEPGPQRLPLGRVHAERVIRAGAARFQHDRRVDRDRQPVVERELTDPVVEVPRPLDQHRVRPLAQHQLAHEPRRGRRVMPDPEPADHASSERAA